jgi:peptidoglycan/LPS O-acetylase OafA/YrhL
MKQSIDNPLSSHKNNFDLLRLVGALLVLFSHSYGEIIPAREDFLHRWTAQRYALSFVGLMIFFSISGYLVTQSLLNSVSVKQYIWKRFLRIYPAYIVITLLSVFILGPVFTTVSVQNYFSDGVTWKFLYKNILIINNAGILPGVFDGKKVNISFWTLPLELKLYGMLLLLYLLRFFHYRWLHAVFFVCVCCVTVFVPARLLQQWFLMDANVWYNLCFFFIAGSGVYIWRDKIVLHYTGIIALALLWLVTAWLHFTGNLPMILFCTYTVLYLGLKTPVVFKPRMDLSYGIYIYASPVQAIAGLLTGHTLSLWQFNLVTIPVTVLMAFLSWQLIEKKSLLLKNKVK